ncbi:hypothetical protein GGX14DRAFT_559378 [Mycena pura]|uniref:Uncharacterized protein n=1 Tax=Mycena pura TaxID=153505 RepID=A0AAD6YGP6_9AGAR|nr:hypothetical protein GGX14DRAFT_559378 [Mycena pura]
MLTGVIVRPAANVAAFGRRSRVPSLQDFELSTWACAGNPLHKTFIRWPACAVADVKVQEVLALAPPPMPMLPPPPITMPTTTPITAASTNDDADDDNHDAPARATARSCPSSAVQVGDGQGKNMPPKRPTHAQTAATTSCSRRHHRQGPRRPRRHHRHRRHHRPACPRRRHRLTRSHRRCFPSALLLPACVATVSPARTLRAPACTRRLSCLLVPPLSRPPALAAAALSAHTTAVLPTHTTTGLPTCNVAIPPPPPCLLALPPPRATAAACPHRRCPACLRRLCLPCLPAPLLLPARAAVPPACSHRRHPARSLSHATAVLPAHAVAALPAHAAVVRPAHTTAVLPARTAAVPPAFLPVITDWLSHHKQICESQYNTFERRKPEDPPYAAAAKNSVNDIHPVIAFANPT